MSNFVATGTLAIKRDHILAVLDNLITQDLQINRNHHLSLIHLVFPRDVLIQQVYTVLVGKIRFFIVNVTNEADHITPDKTIQQNLAAFYAMYILHSTQPQKRLDPILLTPSSINRLVLIVTESGNVLMVKLLKRIAPHFSLVPFTPNLPSSNDPTRQYVPLKAYIMLINLIRVDQELEQLTQEPIDYSNTLLQDPANTEILVDMQRYIQMKEVLKLGDMEDASRQLVSQDEEALGLISINTFKEYQSFIEKNIHN